MKKNNFEGYGTLFYSDGSKYVGYWKDSLKHGKGIDYNSSGRVEFNGMFEKGERQ